MLLLSIPRSCQALFCLNAFALAVLALASQLPAPLLDSSIFQFQYHLLREAFPDLSEPVSPYESHSTLFMFLLAFLVTVCNEVFPCYLSAY